MVEFYATLRPKRDPVAPESIIFLKLVCEAGIVLIYIYWGLDIMEWDKMAPKLMD